MPGQAKMGLEGFTRRMVVAAGGTQSAMWLCRGSAR